MPFWTTQGQHFKEYSGKIMSILLLLISNLYFLIQYVGGRNTTHITFERMKVLKLFSQAFGKY